VFGLNISDAMGIFVMYAFAIARAGPPASAAGSSAVHVSFRLGLIEHAYACGCRAPFL